MFSGFENIVDVRDVNIEEKCRKSFSTPPTLTTKNDKADEIVETRARASRIGILSAG